MGKHYRDNFTIVSGEIWEYETRYYSHLLHKKNAKKANRQKKFLIDLHNRIKSLIVDCKKPYVTRTSDPKKYDALLEEKNNITTFEELLKLDWVFHKENIYTFNHTIPITRDIKDFHYWFAVKIRQYDLDIFTLNDFLEYHFHFSFYNNLWEMAEYLEKLLIQYNFIGPKAAIETETFIEKLDIKIIEEQKKRELILKTQNVSKTKTENKSAKRPRTRENYNAYHLTILQKEPTYLNSYSNGFYRAFQQLIDRKFIKADIDFDFENFKRIFSGKGVTKSKRFIWSGGAIYLKLFVHYLLKTKKIEPMGNENWTTTVKCFLNKEGQEFETSQLQHANGGTDKKIELLYGIIDLL